jgi:membrane-associated protein
VTSYLALSLVERIVNWVEPAFLTAGYLIIAGGVLLERSIFVGLIVPGDVILALGGVYASEGKLNLVLVIVVGTVAAITGESIGFWLGRRYGAGMVRHVPVIGTFMAERLEAAQGFFKRNGGKTVAIGRYATAAGAFIPFTAGVAKMPYRRFIAFDSPAIVLWATGISIFGFAFGKNLAFVDKVLSRFGLIVLGLLAAILLARWLWKRREHRETPGSSSS